MEISIIAVVGTDLSIGRGGDLIRHLREDLRHFKALTSGHAVLMGRKTWLSLPKKPLSGRLNIIVSRNKNFQAEGAVTACDLAEGIRIAEEHGEQKLYIIGGGEIYRQCLPLADRLDLTLVEAPCEDADTFFPEYRNEWIELPGSEFIAANGDTPSFRFATFVRSSNSNLIS
ncbi:MAG: dihydrofolate reductase [Clostridium sp.]|nr:dihydrofolate reductase [Prevotella sp.]MCM1429132.1 dihydrofolate reductase [Clostridium sp.]MCM1475340.1 dihydrofolate reductase [Muribaculaceae bacterium]